MRNGKKKNNVKAKNNYCWKEESFSSGNCIGCVVDPKKETHQTTGKERPMSYVKDYEQKFAN